jgi:hypothetical protein
MSEIKSIKYLSKAEAIARYERDGMVYIVTIPSGRTGFMAYRSHAEYIAKINGGEVAAVDPRAW